MPTPQQALDRALDEETLVLVYQPIHDLRDGTIVAAEALLRQRRKSGEIRSASLITEAAEDAPKEDLFRLDSWVVRQAYADAGTWQSDGSPGVRLNVNLSPREFQEGNVRERLTGLATSCHIDAHNINIEITETSYIEHPKETMHVLDMLKDLGVKLWLDDFGTGHSSLTHLQHFPLDGIKLPASFVAAGDQRSDAIVRALVALAHDLGLKVIAEGVEHEEQRTFLRDLGCEYVQGFLFSKPMELKDFLRLLRE
jgi:EAL domain-containing protein (putative c-di-GMP-specific phosphodiesterase class I)